MIRHIRFLVLLAAFVMIASACWPIYRSGGGGLHPGKHGEVVINTVNGARTSWCIGFTPVGNPGVNRCKIGVSDLLLLSQGGIPSTCELLPSPCKGIEANYSIAPNGLFQGKIAYQTVNGSCGAASVDCLRLVMDAAGTYSWDSRDVSGNFRSGAGCLGDTWPGNWSC
jgi:hypothetical protein